MGLCQKITFPTENSMAIAQAIPIYEATQIKPFQTCTITINQISEGDIVDELAVPNYNGPSKSELPRCTNPVLWRSIASCSIPNQGTHGTIFLWLESQ